MCGGWGANEAEPPHQSPLKSKDVLWMWRQVSHSLPAVVLWKRRDLTPLGKGQDINKWFGVDISEMDGWWVGGWIDRWIDFLLFFLFHLH